MICQVLASLMLYKSNQEQLFGKGLFDFDHLLFICINAVIGGLEELIRIGKLEENSKILS